MRALSALALATLCCGCSCSNVYQVKDPATLAPDGKALRTRSESALDYSVATFIDARPELVWGVLTDAAGYTKWSSTITRLEGTVEFREKLKLVPRAVSDRPVTLRVSLHDAPKELVWEEGNGWFLEVRRFKLSENDGGTVLALSQTYSGVFLGTAEKELPDFTASLEALAADVKREAESR